MNDKVTKDEEKSKKDSDIDIGKIENFVQGVEIGLQAFKFASDLVGGQDANLERKEKDPKLPERVRSNDNGSAFEEKDNFSTKGLNENDAKGDDTQESNATMQIEENTELQLVDNSKEINEPDNNEGRTEVEQEVHLETLPNDVEQVENPQVDETDNLNEDQGDTNNNDTNDNDNENQVQKDDNGKDDKEDVDETEWNDSKIPIDENQRKSDMDDEKTNDVDNANKKDAEDNVSFNDKVEELL